MKTHHYQTFLEWTGNRGEGTLDYRSYSRDHITTLEGKTHSILCSSDSSFRGDPARFNPEELFLASISNCHMLWYLHLCSVNDVIILEYVDKATGVMQEDRNGSGRFTEVTLHPQVKVKDLQIIKRANDLHEEANRMCFIANSCNFKITHKPTIEV